VNLDLKFEWLDSKEMRLFLTAVREGQRQGNVRARDRRVRLGWGGLGRRGFLRVEVRFRVMGEGEGGRKGEKRVFVGLGRMRVGEG
jgi:hypothetical protein